MAASGSLAGSAGSRALSWASIQACHVVRLGQAGHHVGLTAAPPGAVSRQAEVLQEAARAGTLEAAVCSPTLPPDSSARICPGGFGGLGCRKLG